MRIDCQKTGVFCIKSSDILICVSEFCFNTGGGIVTNIWMDDFAPKVHRTKMRVGH